jgi:predicted DNA-binding protein
MSRKKLSTTVYITEEQSERLKQLNDKTRVPIAEFIRQGIDMILDKHKADLPGQLSLLGDRKDSASS